jgi:hypothetical protein
VAFGEHRRREVAEPVDRQDRRILERRGEERARDVCLVVLDVVELRALRYRGLGPCVSVRITFAPRLAFGLRPIAT